MDEALAGSTPAPNQGPGHWRGFFVVLETMSEVRIPEAHIFSWCMHGEALATAKLVSAWRRSSQRSTVNMSTSSEICPSPERAECKR
ncbi:hypothetical protein V5799_012808 [Amblyomma americanum]|uniref:Uncharacterized protein n=1 Tax=Amblyomma americanum TaxID=6943 RepID=A0AAQ4E7N4_AMBAM